MSIPTNLQESNQLQQIKTLPIQLLITLLLVEIAVLAAESAKCNRTARDFAVSQQLGSPAQATFPGSSV